MLLALGLAEPATAPVRRAQAALLPPLGRAGARPVEAQAKTVAELQAELDSLYQLFVAAPKEMIASCVAGARLQAAAAHTSNGGATFVPTVPSTARR